MGFNRLPLLLILVTAVSCSRNSGTEFTLKVVDEGGRPVAGAYVDYVFFSEQLKRKRLDQPEEKLTDETGSFIIQGPADTDLAVTVTKPGWYESAQQILLREVEDLVSIELRDHREPIAMAVRFVRLLEDINAGTEFGYDLLQGDLVAPNGSGVTADLILHLVDRSESIARQDWELKIMFSNHLDGIQRVRFPPRASTFRSDYEAPVDGYQNQILVSRKIDINAGSREGSWDVRNNYYVRVRSRLEDGKVVGHYGKIYGEFPEIVHFLNPTPGDRNVEWDPAKNLIRIGRSEQRPVSP